MRLWLNKGVDGLRMDAFQYVSKDTVWPILPRGYEKNIIKYYGMGQHLHDYLQEMNREVISKYDIMTVAEGAGSTFEDAHALVDPERKELNMAYHFEVMDIGNDPKGYSLLDFKRVFTRWDSAFAEKGWVAIFLGNHDVPRMVSKYGNDSPEFRERSSKVLTTFILSMRGTPYCYYGDELGMANIKFDRIEDYKDIATINAYKSIKNKGGDLQQFMEFQKFISRDNARTPFQWDASANAGFTTGISWLKVNPDHRTVNAATQEKDPNSVLNYFRKMVQLRKENPVLVYGNYTLLDKNNPNIYAYTREGGGKKLLVLLNFTKKDAKVDVSMDMKDAKVLVCNYQDVPIREGGKAGVGMRPYEAVIYQVQ
jgi:oligo-1,6-glucosidase